MKILHLTPHLGGGVGKAHAAIVAAGSPDVRRTYFLLEEPRDRRFPSLVEAAGSRLTTGGPAELQAAVEAADVVQIEWWNHPRLYQCLSEWSLPAMRSVVWAHISGLFPPLLPERLAEMPDRLLFTSPCSLQAENLQNLPQSLRSRLGVVNSGFGFEPVGGYAQNPSTAVYLGTVDFVKMHPAFFEIVDAARHEDFNVAVWGQFDPNGEPASRAAAMRRPARVSLKGAHQDPQSMLSAAGILVYLLRPDHYGTAENVLIEAMSLGVAPLVMANPAEMAVVEDGRTGLVATDAADAAVKLAWMLRHPEQVAAMGRAAAATIARTHSAASSARALETCYGELLPHPKRVIDFAGFLGSSAADWFLSTQTRRGVRPARTDFSSSGAASKGSLAHFLACMPEDLTLRSLTNDRPRYCGIEQYGERRDAPRTVPHPKLKSL
jgi:glycosyltransferase involved in cell wall biosynthesis